MRAFIAILLAIAALGCKEQHEPCSGMRFDPLTLPLSFGVTSGGSPLGKVTMDTQQNATFEPDAAADPERLARFKTDFEKHVAANEATYEYSDRDSDGTHFSCGGRTPKGVPEYPAAFKLSLYSDYYELVDDPK